MAVYTYDSPERFVAGTVGQPGQRTFYLQASSGGRVTSVVVEKFQVSLLAERIDDIALGQSGGRRRLEPGRTSDAHERRGSGRGQRQGEHRSPNAVGTHSLPFCRPSAR